MCDKTSFRSRSCRSCHQVDKLMKAAWAEFAEMDAAAQEPYIKMADDDKVLRQVDEGTMRGELWCARDERSEEALDDTAPA